MNPESSDTPPPDQPDQPCGINGQTSSSPAEDENSDSDAGITDDAEISMQNRRWLKTIVPLLQLRSQETDPSGRVQYALDQMYVAACERVARILRSDLPDDAG